ncbi:MAG: hypothetical protein ACTSYB_10950 [Candidatus Helarchaeota archaeon]
MVGFKGFWKTLGNIGKRLFYKRETKLSLYLFSAMHHTMIDIMANFYEDNYEDAMESLIDLVKPLSEEIISELLFETSVLGVSFKKIISKFKDPKDFAYIIDMAMYSVWGGGFKKIFSKTKYLSAIESSEKVHTYVLMMKSCPFCFLTMVSPEKFGAYRFGKLLTLTIEQIVQLSQDFLGNNFQVVAREVKCFHQGDPCGEIRIWLYPRDNLQLMESNPYLHQIK